MNVNLGPREAEMLMDALSLLELSWEDRGELDPPVPFVDEQRLRTLMLKLRAARRAR